jgi:hypothetical protein
MKLGKLLALLALSNCPADRDHSSALIVAPGQRIRFVRSCTLWSGSTPAVVSIVAVSRSVCPQTHSTSTRSRGPTERHRRAPQRAPWPSLYEPTQHSVHRARDAHDMPAVELHHRLVAALISIVNDRDRLLPNGIPGAVNAGDQHETTRYALSLNGHTPSLSCRARNNTRTA